MWLKDFERFEKKTINKKFKLIINIIVINLEDYKKFF